MSSFSVLVADLLIYIPAVVIYCFYLTGGSSNKKVTHLPGVSWHLKVFFFWIYSQISPDWAFILKKTKYRNVNRDGGIMKSLLQYSIISFPGSHYILAGIIISAAQSRGIFCIFWLCLNKQSLCYPSMHFPFLSTYWDKYDALLSPKVGKSEHRDGMNE